MIEVADAAPLAMPERIRARLHVTGYDATQDECDGLHLQARRVDLIEGCTSVEVKLVDLLAASPDPLIEHEASVLAHLPSQHDDVLKRWPGSSTPMTSRPWSACGPSGWIAAGSGYASSAPQVIETDGSTSNSR